MSNQKRRLEARGGRRVRRDEFVDTQRARITRNTATLFPTIDEHTGGPEKVYVEVVRQKVEYAE
jgi:hypothetical protein